MSDPFCCFCWCDGTIIMSGDAIERDGQFKMIMA
jgi:hypothetical protein